MSFRGNRVFRTVFPSLLVATAAASPLLSAGADESAAAVAAVPEAPARRGLPREGVWSVVFENDVFANTDRHYTNGVRIARLSPLGEDVDMLKNALAAFPLLSRSADIRTEWSIGQSMFTPRRIVDAIPNPSDRPYAGWLYAAFGLIAEDGNTLDQLQTSIGVVGPWSFAEETQKAVHRLTGSDQPQGWYAQLRNEPVAQMTYQRSWRRVPGDRGVLDVRGYRIDLTTHSGGSAGNAFIYGNAGATVRFGKDLPEDYGPPRVPPSLPGSGYFQRPPGDAFGWYLFAGVDGRVVARNMFLDGNAFRNGPSVERRWFVHDLQAGGTLSFAKLQLSYTHVWRSAEFEGQAVPDRFGALSVTWSW